MVIPNVLLVSNNPWQDLLFPRTYKPRKNIPVLAGIAFEKSDFLGQNEAAQNGCAAAKIGTVLNIGFNIVIYRILLW